MKKMAYVCNLCFQLYVLGEGSVKCCSISLARGFSCPLLACGGKAEKNSTLNFDTLELYFHIPAVSIGVTVSLTSNCSGLETYIVGKQVIY